MKLHLRHSAHTEGAIWTSVGTSLCFRSVQLLQSKCPLASLMTAWTNSFSFGCLSACWRYMMSPIISAWKAIGFLIRSWSWDGSYGKGLHLSCLYKLGITCSAYLDLRRNSIGKLILQFFVTWCKLFNIDLYQTWDMTGSDGVSPSVVWEAWVCWEVRLFSDISESASEML